MFKAQRKILKNKKGMTLIEVLAIIVILAIIAAISVPAIMNVVAEQRAKSFRSDLSALETQVVKLQNITTQIDYSQTDVTPGTVGKGSLTGVLDAVKISALTSGTDALPKKVGFDTSKDGLQITLVAAATGATGNWCVQPVAPAVCLATANSIDTELANQLAAIYLTNTTVGNTVSVIARPVDLSLIYAAKLVTNKVNYPKVLPALGFQTGSKYQDRSFSNIANGLASTDALVASNVNLFPSTPDVPGYYFLVDNTTLIYSGTDARINNTQVVHTSSAYEKK